MAEEVGKFSLEHVSNVYTQDASGQISNHTNWKGTSDVAGTVYGTLIFGPNPLMEMNDSLEGGPVKWIGQAFLEDGTGLAGSGSGQWSKKPGEHIWKTDCILQISDGTKIRSVGDIHLDTLTFSGTNYSVDEQMVK